MQARQAFLTRAQQEKEDWMQYLEALEGLRSQGFPQEPMTTKRYEVLQPFLQEVRDPLLRRDLSIVYESESSLADPPTVESLRFTTRKLRLLNNPTILDWPRGLDLIPLYPCNPRSWHCHKAYYLPLHHLRMHLLLLLLSRRQERR